MLSGFKKMNIGNTGFAYMSITDAGITFNRAAVEGMGCPEYVFVLENQKDRQFAIQIAKKGEPGAITFYRPKRSNLISVRWNNQSLIATLRKMMIPDLQQAHTRINGRYIEEEGAMIFNMLEAYRADKG